MNFIFIDEEKFMTVDQILFPDFYEYDYCDDDDYLGVCYE